MFIFAIAMQVPTAIAQSLPPEAAPPFFHHYYPKCTSSVDLLRENYDIGVALKSEPTWRVCGCASSAMRSDPRLKQLFNLNQEEISKALQSSSLRSYVSIKSSASTYSCLAEALNRGIANIPLEK
jgi:hypothetical protein